MKLYDINCKKVIRIENKMTGEICESVLGNWRIVLNAIKDTAEWENIKIMTKATDVINNLTHGYEDKYIKAYIHEYK